MDDLLYDIVILDGDISEFWDTSTNVLRFDGLTLDETLDLAKKSILRGYWIAAKLETVEGEEDDTNGKI